jgi:hypothetical protein
MMVHVGLLLRTALIVALAHYCHGRVDDHNRINKGKKFVYLIQSSKPQPDSRLLPNNSRDVLYLCFVKGCDISHVPPSEVRVRLGLSWTAGRNSLLTDAIARAALMPNGGYEYYIFMDDDIPDMVIGDAPWDDFEMWLAKTRPAIGYLTNSVIWHNSASLGAPFNVDANVNAFHCTTLGMALPYDDTLDDQSIFFSQYIQNMLAGAVYASQRRGFDGIQFNHANNRHHEAPPDEAKDIFFTGSMLVGDKSKHHGSHNYNRSKKWTIPKQYMDLVFRNLTAMHQAVVTMNCNEPNNDRYCQYKQCPLQPLSGPVDEKWWIQNTNDPNHTSVALTLTFLRKHFSFLEKTRGLYTEFVPYSAGFACNTTT